MHFIINILNSLLNYAFTPYSEKIFLKLWLNCLTMLPLLSPALLTSCLKLHCALQTEYICPSLQLLQQGKTKKNGNRMCELPQWVPKGQRRDIELE